MEFPNNPTEAELLIAALRGNQRPAPVAESPVGVPRRGQLTADILRRQGNELTPNAPLPNIPMGDVVQPIANRPTVQSLYDKLDIVNRKPLDYSGLEAINRSRAEGSKNDFLGGLALQMMGGKSIAPAGAHVFEQALKDREPIRPNAADIGWTDPTTGKVIENPMMARNQEEKLVTGRIDALIKEEEAKARIAIEKGQKELAAQHQRNMEILLAQKTAAQVTVINNRAVSDDQRAAGKGGKPVSGIISPDGKPLFVQDGVYRTGDGTVVTNPLTTAGFVKQTESMKQGDDGYEKAKSLLAEAKANPGAFGMLPSLASSFPTVMSLRSKAEGLVMNEKQRMVRAGLAERSSAIIKQMSGAAVSGAEQLRLEQYVPTKDDDAETIKIKLKDAIRDYEAWKTRVQGRGPVNASPSSLPARGDDPMDGALAEKAKRDAAKRSPQ